MKKYMNIREESNKKIGVYLGKLIDDKFSKRNNFYREYLRHEGLSTDAEEVRKLANRFSQIIKGDKSLQVHDLLIVTDILGVSCEELLTCGKAYKPIKNHVTNYDIAFSKDPKVWQKYMSREDNLFLNYDEYNKSVIDYAFEFKNYGFIHWLVEKGYIYFTEEKQPGYGLPLFKAETKVERRNFMQKDNLFPLEIEENEQLRGKLIALAIEHGDISVMEEMKGRETPLVHEVSHFSAHQEERFDGSEQLVKSIACSNSDSVYKYFAQEYDVENHWGKTYTFIYPHLGDVIDVMIEENINEDAVRMMVRNVIKHNKEAYEWVKGRIESDYAERIKDLHGDPKYVDMLKKDYRMRSMSDFTFRPDTNMFSYGVGSEDGMRTVIIPISGSSTNPVVQNLIDEAMGYYNKFTEYANEQKELWNLV